MSIGRRVTLEILRSLHRGSDPLCQTCLVDRNRSQPIKSARTAEVLGVPSEVFRRSLEIIVWYSDAIVFVMYSVVRPKVRGDAKTS